MKAKSSPLTTTGNLKQYLFRYGDILLIVICALFLYSYRLSEVPNGLYNDEASIGYNALSLITTGKDEHGEAFPLYFLALNDYKNPLYIYIATLPLYFLGATDWALRFTSVLFAIGNITLIYLIGRYILGQRIIGFFAAFFLAIMPWHFEIHRIAFEVACTTFFLLSSIFCLSLWMLREKAKNHQEYLLYIGIFLLALYLYSYSTAKLLSPLILIIFGLINLRRFWAAPGRLLIVSEVIFGLVVFPFIWYYLTVPNFTWVIKAISIFATSETPLALFRENYLGYFSSEYLLQRGDTNPRHHIVGSGQGEIYYSFALLAIIGVMYLAAWFRHKAVAVFFILLLMVTPIAASLTNSGGLHALRSLLMAAFIALFAAVGAYALYLLSDQIKLKSAKWGMFALLLLFPAYEAQHFFRYYFNEYPTKASYGMWDWQKEEVDINRFLLDHITEYDIVYETLENRHQVEIFHKWYLPREEVGKIKYLRDFVSPAEGMKTLLIIHPSEAILVAESGWRKVGSVNNGEKELFTMHSSE